MSTVYYPCTYCGEEIGSAQDITWNNDKPFHPDCVGIGIPDWAGEYCKHGQIGSICEPCVRKLMRQEREKVVAAMLRVVQEHHEIDDPHTCGTECVQHLEKALDELDLTKDLAARSTEEGK